MAAAAAAAAATHLLLHGSGRRAAVAAVVPPLARRLLVAPSNNNATAARLPAWFTPRASLTTAAATRSHGTAGRHRVPQMPATGRRGYRPVNDMTVYPVHARTPWWETAASVGVLAALLVPSALLYGLFREAVPISGRTHVVVIDAARERELGLLAAEETIRGKRVLPASHPYSVALLAIGTRIADAVDALTRVAPAPAAAAAERGAAGDVAGSGHGTLRDEVAAVRLCADVGVVGALRGAVGRLVEVVAGKVSPASPSRWPWRFLVVESPVVNAFCAPGGIVVVHTGLLQFVDEQVRAGTLPDRESAVATLVAHEVAHAVARHGAEGLSKVPWRMWVSALAASSPLLPFLYAGLVELPYSRMMEEEADDIGLELLAHACYDHSAAKHMYANLHSTSELATWVSSHPSDASRAENAASHSARLALRYRTHCRHLVHTPRVEAALATPFIPTPALDSLAQGK